MPVRVFKLYSDVYYSFFILIMWYWIITTCWWQCCQWSATNLMRTNSVKRWYLQVTRSPYCHLLLSRFHPHAEGWRSFHLPVFSIVACLLPTTNTPPRFYLTSPWHYLFIDFLFGRLSTSSGFFLPDAVRYCHRGAILLECRVGTFTGQRRRQSISFLHRSHDWSIVACTFVLLSSFSNALCSIFILICSVVKSRWLCYFQESRSTCQKFYFLESRSSVKIFYFLESRK